uniref:SXP/RAL-2 family protein Ani s 5-like cation-binding domain-containing protein n=1 Tax=Meloidogyne incognita TaxID=6306 RepID=A0A914N1H3_MELIC
MSKYFCGFLSLFFLLELFLFIYAQSTDNSTGYQMSISDLINKLPIEEQIELQQLLAGGENLTKKVFNAQMDKWASKQSDYFYSCYEEMKEGFYDAKEILDERHDQLMSNQTAEVKDADKRIREINNNQNITMKQEIDQINQLINSLPQNVAQTIIQLAPYQAINSNNNNANT